MRRKQNVGLVANEEHTLSIAAELFRQGHQVIHGYQLSQAMRQAGGKRMAVSTLYRCLDRLEQFGLLESSWEPSPEGHRGPPRRLYTLTPKGLERAAEVTKRYSESVARVRWSSA